MKAFYLVIDTETSGLPKNWDLPYDTPHNWPYILQIAWIIFDADGNEIKRENHYLEDDGFKIAKSAFNIHHINKEFLAKHGENRKEVLSLLAEDLKTYEPLVIGHFVELDFHMVEAAFQRSGLENVIHYLPLFCTMNASIPYIKNPSFKFLKLEIFYKTLFHKKPEKIHDALADAELTAEIFFHLLEKGEVSEKKIIHQQQRIKRTYLKNKQLFRWVFAGLAFLIVLLLIWLFDAT